MTLVSKNGLSFIDLFAIESEIGWERPLHLTELIDRPLPGAVAGVNSRRAVPGDTITIYGVGFGAVAPIIAAGQVVQQANTLTGSFQIKFGSTVASTTYDGLAPNVVGLYQFNVVVPSIPSSDAVPVTFRDRKSVV